MQAEKRDKLGILGGMGPQATQVLYQWILDRTDADSDQEHVPAVILSDTLMPDRTEAILSGNTDGVRSRLIEDAKLLQSCGCGCIAIPCNTSHYFWEDIQASVDIPVLNMPRLAVEVLKDQRAKKTAILATDGTLSAGVFHRELAAAGIEAWAPPADIQKTVMSIIYDEIKAGEKGSRSKFARIDRAIREAGCDSAVLGCTELSVYRGNHGLPEMYCDAMEVLAERCISFFGRKLKRV